MVPTFDDDLLMSRGLFNETVNHTVLAKLADLPWLLISLITITSSIGFVMMYSAAKGSLHPWASRQIFHFCFFFPIMLIIALVDIRFWFRYTYLAFAISLILLVIVEITGHTAMGATRWINLGSFKLQPSEIIKLSLIFALARYFHTINQVNVGQVIFLIPPCIIILVPFLLIMKQPDLGTAIILLLTSTMIFFAAGVRIWKFVIIGIVGVCSMPIAWQFLHDYQKKRVITFLDPASDPLGAGYNIIQSKIAIGSGGFFGKGLLQGSQSQLNFLPEHQTDFIFTMLSEELGFMGGITILILYTGIIAYGIFIALNSRNHFGRLLAIGITSLFFLHVFINMAMVMGMMPVVGVPLPLLSYGGTMMMTMLIGFGLLMNVHLHRHVTFSRSVSG